MALIIWIVLGCIALAVVHVPSVVRTQEARVLETARQMKGGGVQARLVPLLNGQPRLQKPPLAYWLSDASFQVFGIQTAGTGRIPFALAAWLTAGLNLLIGTRLFGPLAGTFAMASLLGCVLGARYGLLAETDVLTMLGVTAAIYAHWRGAEAAMAAELPDAAAGPTPGRVALLFHAGAIATALTILAKGPQGAFPVLFLIGLAVARRTWTPITAWLKSAAPLTLLVIAAPWFIYIFASVGRETIVHEVRVASLGGAHQGWFVKYFGYVPVDALPWTGFLIAALWFGLKRARRDRRLAGLLVWILVILVPLCLAGQKQRHYLMPLMPPLMLLTGWYLDRAVRFSRSAHGALARGITWWTAVACAVGGALLPLAALMARQRVDFIDFVIGLLLLVTGLGVIVTLRHSSLGRAVAGLACAGAAAMLLLQNLWAPTLKLTSPRSIARDVAQDFSGQPVRTLGEPQLELMFELRSAPVALLTPDEVAAALASNPQTIFVEHREKDEVSHVPPTLVLRRSYVWDGDIVSIYERKP